MPALGQKRAFRSANRHVRLTPESRHVRRKNKCPLSAKSGLYAEKRLFIRSTRPRVRAAEAAPGGQGLWRF